MQPRIRSPVNNIELSRQLEREQRRATKWILVNSGELSYKERSSTLDLLPLSYGMEIEDLSLLT